MCIRDRLQSGGEVSDQQQEVEAVAIEVARKAAQVEEEQTLEDDEQKVALILLRKKNYSLCVCTKSCWKNRD